ncbi:MAG: hypothetical protein A2821_04475 [Candidatus Magasanikbacteria bacterium RIFCSPHIGHO2_01_FULL_41_23]|uniref:Methyltransferase domain-containing protein n=1 Tax=Candidatus Magasanikbacteria bacterium RIFCSPLOWO2_01_FULL_40_15 TaxID=1798686 RepID=A0A1F6N4P2_9BACT|nr:MAG: hypothetical protein A2821_04475 [Candidatus Magasanikbacteria bacterium RIFCSPHIGHO2_01_FULL_41_23]OGH67181.1 MAG: hypothetical protein A3C66_02790 [Candidatus Magasanikbacteria bacterium RIFCSPHIGHO2_02_FULL_41_35]OGH75454.1 MAG: hypothetical protein A3F22_01355 [Candidatus Magasanikbacteria bacterium RIFCSPHIGHO2_12_FULL_41_16]OGH78718.1 MAG: hypothetical protein A2983_04430 [Candidatus Magasanikbacteria bacterium RIFCSPLOWO2_01_FULL_40_15]
MTYTTGTALVDSRDLFERAHVQAGMHVADFGSGRTGHMVFPAAKIVGEHGVVYAVDILKEVLTLIKKRADMEAFVNIHPLWADIERANGVSIPRGSLDVIFMINILHHLMNMAGSLSEAERLLKPKGRIVVMDWTGRLGQLGPTEDKKLNFSAVLEWARAHEFGVQDDFMPNQYLRGLVLFRHD